MNDILAHNLHFVLRSGKMDKVSPYPPDMKGQDGADELAKQALEEGIRPERYS